MSSRRLTISSLLCDDVGPSPTRTSHSPSQSPQLPLFAYASFQHSSSFADAVSRRELNPAHRSTGNRANSTTPSPRETASIAAPCPISPKQRRDHSSSSSIPRQMSPPLEIRETSFRWRSSEAAVADRDAAGAAVQDQWTTMAIGEFPRLVDARGAHSPCHPPYPQYHPSSTLSYSDVVGSEPTSTTSQIPDSYNRFSTSSLSPANDVSTYSHPILCVNTERAMAHSEFPRSVSPIMHSSHGQSRSISQRHASDVSRLPRPSGLDVLVQAATEERERIDEHRRIIAYDESQCSPFSISGSAQSCHSPAARTDTQLRPSPSPSPTQLASSQNSAKPFVTNQHAVDHGHDGESLEGRERIAILQCSSPKLASSRYNGDTTTHLFDPTTSTKACEASEPNVPLIVNYHGDGESIGVLAPVMNERYSNELPSSNCSPTASTSLQLSGFSNYASPEALSSHAPVLRPVADSANGTFARRSPPRSKPKPKKPGSVALCHNETKVCDLGLSDDTSKEKAQGARGNSTERDAPMQNKRRTDDEEQSDGERFTDADAAIEDFFLSAFESPKPSERKVHSQTLSTDASSHTTPCRTSPTIEMPSISDPNRSPSWRLEEPSAYGKHSVYSMPNVDDQTVCEADSELYEELAEAVDGNASTEDERAEPYSEIEAMDVDVEDELLSLIDGPTDHEAKPHLHHQAHVHRTQALGLMEHDIFPGAPRRDVEQNDHMNTNKSICNPSKKKNDAARTSAKSSKLRVTKDNALKTAKSKSGTRSKTAKDAKHTLLHTITAFSATDRHSEDAFPVVTSSGRMVTKSRKSAAATASTLLGHVIGQTKKKRASSVGMDGTSSRSRSHSVMPGGFLDSDMSKEKFANLEEEKAKDADEDIEEEDDKLYCICRTSYDEDKVMIACDRCDEWYHTQCVKMPDLELDLVDQFICPNCVAQNPDLQLRTTWKRRCFTGLSHPEPNSADACHKPSRGAYSKYCSDECGVRYLHAKIQGWSSMGGDVHGLWESVKDVKRREGVVIKESARTLPKRILAELNYDVKGEMPEGKDHSAFVKRRLESQLQEILRERESSKKDLDIIGWRERLLRLASERSEILQECGWDQRLCFGDEEWMEFGEGVLESYEDTRLNGHAEEGNRCRTTGSDEQVTEGEWWCRGKKKCERHAGWQKLRSAEIQLERDSKEDALSKLTTREREIRNRIEDILHPHVQGRSTVRASVFNKQFINGNATDDGTRKGKRKPAAST